MDERTYDRLRDISKGQQVALPFIPWEGEKYLEMRENKLCPRIMFTGIATDGWGHEGKGYDHWTYQESQKTLSEWVRDNIFSGGLEKIDRTFWNSGRKICQRILSFQGIEVGESYEAVIPYICWNNLWKVGGETGNPDRALRNAQFELSANTISQELNDLEPTIVILFVGDSNDEPDLIYSAIAARPNWSTIDGGHPKIWTTETENDCKIYWTPRRGSGAAVDDIVVTILQDLRC